MGTCMGEKCGNKHAHKHTQACAHEYTHETDEHTGVHARRSGCPLHFYGGDNKKDSTGRVARATAERRHSSVALAMRHLPWVIPGAGALPENIAVNKTSKPLQKVMK